MGVISFVKRVAGRRDVFLELVKREVFSRYSGSALGLLWSFLNPLLMLAVYTLAFRQLLGMRWPSADNGVDFSLMIFSGMIVHSLLVECLMRSPTIIVANSNLVKRVVFPLAVLPCVTVASALFNAVLSIFVMLLFVLLTRETVPLSAFYLPLLFAPFLMLLCGISWFMASLDVFLRDITQLTGTLSTIFMFLSPVFYPTESLHEPYRSLVAYNPLTFIIEQTRGLLFLQRGLDWWELGKYTLVAIFVMVAGYWWFQRTREGFADVL